MKADVYISILQKWSVSGIVELIAWFENYTAPNQCFLYEKYQTTT